MIDKILKSVLAVLNPSPKVEVVESNVPSQTNSLSEELMLVKSLSSCGDNPIERHFIYNQLIDILYKQRNSRADALDLCIKYCIEDIDRIEAFKVAYIKEYEGIQDNLIASGYKSQKDRYEVKLPRIPSFSRLRIIYEKQGKYREAIQVCSKAIEVEAWDIEAGNEQISKLIKKMKKAEG